MPALPGSKDLAACLSRVERLQVQLARGTENAGIVREILQDLSVALEELQVADEEIRQQNEQLREARAKIETERERYRRQFEFAPDPYLLTGADGVIIEANAAASGLLQRSALELRGKPLAVCVDEAARREFRLRLTDLRPGTRITGWHSVIRGRPKGACVPVEMTAEAFGEEDGIVIRWLLRDATERSRVHDALEEARRDLEDRVARRTTDLMELTEALREQLGEREHLVQELQESEQRLMLQQKELARSNQDLQDFAYVASHDLKEPLRGISNFAQFILEDDAQSLPPESRERMESIARLARRLHDLLESLLEYSRAGRMNLRQERVDLGSLAVEVRDALSAWLSEHHAEMGVVGPLPEVLCDRARISEVLSNLVVNAIKYNTSPAPRVEVSRATHSPQSVARILVSDNGIGIEPRHSEAIFKMFRRLHPRDRFGGGTGAGLAIVRKIVERHGGKITVESTPGKGSTFVIDLPMSPEPAGV